MSEQEVRASIVATGDELPLPKAEVRIVAADALALDHDIVTDAMTAAARDGAVAIAIPTFDEDEPTRIAVVARVDAPWSLLEIDACTLGVAASRGRGSASDSWFIALVADDIDCSSDAAWEEAPHAAAGDVLRARRDGRLRPHPIVSTEALRDWAWPWSRAWGPLTLTVNLRAPGSEIARFAAESCGLMPYRPSDGGKYLRARTTTLPEERPPMLVAFENGFQWVRSYTEPSEAIVAFDAGVLAALAHGALGELSWDVVDEEYASVVASGDDAASLAAHLSPSVDRDALEKSYRARAAVRSYDLTAAATPAEAVALLATLLGAQETIAEVDFDAWYGTRATSGAVPWNMQLVIGQMLAERHGTEWLSTRLLRPRMRCVGIRVHRP